MVERGGARRRGGVLDEVGLVGARCVDGRGLGGGLLAAGKGQVHTAEQSTEGTHGELESDNGQYVKRDSSAARTTSYGAGGDRNRDVQLTWWEPTWRPRMVYI